MKVCGFTFIRNAEKFDFPVVEAITSILPVCDHFIVAVGNSDDQTREIIERIDPEKISIVDTVWNEKLQKGGVVYAVETDKAFDAIPDGFDWCFYIQGDEVVHEKYLPAIQQAMSDQVDNKKVEGFLFGFRHFFGTYDYVGDSRKWYRHEIRIIRHDKAIRSYRDAQGFRKQGRKLNVVPVTAEVYHYGWVRPPRFMQEKIDEVHKFYQGDNPITKKKDPGESEFDYQGNYDALAKFEGTHPRVMHHRIKRLNWKVEVDLKRIKMKPKYRLLYAIEKKIGIRLFEYRNYSVLKK
ncbi:MAG: hypothetical protein WCY58_09185 [Mariniphaga sp.]|nr:hypothetical protein [Mariniphaga sp.]MDD4225267.1 hypothetical protein [Mariniphaga sp.]